MRKITQLKSHFLLTLTGILIFLNSGNTQAQCVTELLDGTRIANGNGYRWADSFLAPCSGKLEYVQYYAAAAGTLSGGTLKVYAGQGVTTTPIYTQDYGSFTVAAGAPIRVDLSGELNLTAGAAYTFELYINGVNVYYISSFSAYPGGAAFQNGVRSYQHNFRLNVIGTQLETEEVNRNSDVAVFPNPSNGQFTIQTGNAENTLVDIYNIIGKKIFSANPTQQKTIEINLSGQPKGIYIVKIENSGKTTVKKLTVQ